MDGTFTRDEWDFLSSRFELPDPRRCPTGLDAMQCLAAAELGHRLFFEAKLSGEIRISDPKAPGRVGEVGKVSCASCHDAKRFMIDTRSSPQNVSSGAGYTRHNALTVMNLGYKYALAEQACDAAGADPLLCDRVFSWTGVYPTAGEVFILANGAGAMNSSGDRRARTICDDPRYRGLYLAAFGGLPAVAEPPHAECPSTGHDAATVELNLGLAFEAYLLPMTSAGSDFDRYVAGELIDDRTSNHDALGDAERRGLRVFLREGMCVECHGGPLLSDLRFHNTGVKQAGSNVVTTDLGLGGTEIDMVKYPEFSGMFLTQSLRNVAESAPYMHAGQYASLAEVIAFYRRGGDPEGTFSGERDRRLLPLDMTDEQAADLEAFLAGALTGNGVDPALGEPLP